MDVREAVGLRPSAPPLEVHLGLPPPDAARRRRLALAFWLALLIHLAPVLLVWVAGRRALVARSGPVPVATPTPVKLVFYETRSEPQPPPPETEVHSDRASRARSEVKPEEPGPGRVPAAAGADPRAVAPRSRLATGAPAAGEAAPANATPPARATPEAVEAAHKASAEPRESAEDIARLSALSPSRAAASQERLAALGVGGAALDARIRSEGFGGRPGSVLDTGPLEFDAKDFEWGPYARKVFTIVDRNWKSVIPLAARMPGVSGRVTVRFRILRDGRIIGPDLVESSGRGALDQAALASSSLDQAALASIELSDPLPPLPEDFPRDEVGVTFRYYYNLPVGAGD